MFAQPLNIRGLRIPNRTILAPLAGVSDVPFRRLCKEFGAGLTFVEMLSSAGVNFGNRRTMRMLTRHESEDVLGVQVSGPDAGEIARSVAVLGRHGFDIVDINMGCPVRKIVSSGWGSAFLKDPDRVSATVELSRAASSKPLTVKCRLGFTRDTCNIDDIATRIVRGGADLLTIHGRFRTDDYAIGVRLDTMAGGFAAARLAAGERPMAFAGNGDVMDLASAQRMVERTGCDAVMVSRGALGNPWIFEELLTGKPATPALEEWLDVTLRFIGYHEEFYGEGELSARRMRKHLLWFSTGYPRCNRLRERCNGVASLAEARDVVREYAAQYPAHLRRYIDVEESQVSDPKFQMDRTLDRGVA